MTELHPITPPPKLIKEWIREANHNEPMFEQIAQLAAQWGADTELEACCKWIDGEIGAIDTKDLCAARRPKPPSLKEQALGLINSNSPYLDDTAMSVIRRALESLPD
jgi:hypothetical protein